MAAHRVRRSRLRATERPRGRTGIPVSLSFGGRLTAKPLSQPGDGRAVRKKELEIALASLAGHLAPQPKPEQYATPPAIAADVLWFAFSMEDVAGRAVLDLGCGVGILGIGAALLGASEVVGIDNDPAVIDLARANARRVGAAVRFEVLDVESFRGTADTVVMNPPFGAQRRHADRPFLEAAVRAGRIVYSFHNAATEAFVARKLSALGATPTHRKEYAFPIPHTFPFHRAETKEVPVVLFRSERGPAAKV